MTPLELRTRAERALRDLRTLVDRELGAILQDLQRAEQLEREAAQECEPELAHGCDCGGEGGR